MDIATGYSPVDRVTSAKSFDPHTWWFIAISLFCLVVLFSDLGGAALFEPDEGRNAEVAREVLLLDDWITPHYDFIPRLDKPAFFFGLVALAFKVFGLSEWAARLPSVLAALGCLSLTYIVARSVFGRWAALWSVLILLTSVEFFALSRVVILDMVLTMFITLSLVCFWLGHRATGARRKFLVLLMYASMGAATLVKGPIGFVLPAAVIFFYLLLSGKWALLREMEVSLGVPLFLILAGSWYVAVEFRNPGYLHHFLYEENFARFTSTQFNRSGPWYYFFMVLAAGFFPWTLLLPMTLADFRKRPPAEGHLFLSLWMALPFIVFSLSASKLPHYILPLYPPLAILVGASVAKAYTAAPSAKTSWVLSLPAITFFLVALLPALLFLPSDFLPKKIQPQIYAVLPRTSVLFTAAAAALLLGLAAYKKGLWRREFYVYGSTAVGFALFILVAEPITASVSLTRSSKQLAEAAASVIHQGDQLVLYEKYLSSLPFYLRIQQPIWVVWSGDKSKVLGSDYIAKKRPEPAAGYGKVLYIYEEFTNLSRASKSRLVVFVDDRAFDALPIAGGAPTKLLDVGGISLVTNHPEPRLLSLSRWTQ
ncbi:MAG TPA: glycosyltransferase family 39 protein [Candidatus Binatia bacterium]